MDKQGIVFIVTLPQSACAESEYQPL